MPKVKANGIDLNYETHGRGEPLLLIAGLGATGEMWDNQVPLLAREFQVITFDNRGAGRSDKPQEPYSIAMFADLGETELRGFEDPVRLYELRWREAG